MKPIIYLCKSNAVPESTLQQIRDILGQLECEVLEYKKGDPYTNEDLFKANIVLVIPENPVKDNSVLVGKGQFSQIADYARNYLEIPSGIPEYTRDIQIIDPLLTDTFFVKSYVSRKVLNPGTWKVGFGVIDVQDDIPYFDIILDLCTEALRTI